MNLRERVNKLSPQDLRLLRQRLQKAAARADREQLDRRGSVEAVPLSVAQEQLWFVDQLDPDASRAYQIGTSLRLAGELDVVALRRALDRIVARHEALRTVFRYEREQAVQVIVPQAPFSLLESDCSALESQEREDYLAREIQAESDRRFDLSTGPLIRGRLLKRSAQEHVLLLSMHHIVSDGWSISLLTKELSALYAAYRQADQEPMADLPVQYADYTLWQRQRLQGPVLQEHMRYWQESLQGAPELLRLPTDWPRPARSSYRGGSVPVELGEPLSAGLRELSTRHGTTLFMTLYSGFAVLLARLSGQSDVVIGTPVANRPWVELEEVIGFFVNTLALRCRVSGEQPVSELLREVKRQTLAAYSHAELPFERVVEVLQPQRSLSHNPLFQAVFALQNTPRSQWELPGLQLSAPEFCGMSTAQFDLTLSLQEAGGRIVGVLNYARDLFERETIERWVECLQELLQGMVLDDQQAVGELPLLNERQREQVIRQFNAPMQPAAPDRGIHELFEEQARRTPDAVAVACEDHSLTYEKLNARASQLARYLQVHSVRSQDRVALWLPRSVELLFAQLAVLKCGGSYVPLDTDLPEARQEFVLRDCAARHVLCWQGGRPCVLEGIEYIEVEQAVQGVADAPSTVVGTPEWIAYVMYTSGSSGQPKGVEVPHRGIVRLVRENGYAPIGTEDRVAFASNPAFDASTFEVWGALANGAAVRIVHPQELLEGEKLAQGLKRDGVSVLWLTAGLFNQYATSLRDFWTQLKYLLVGGDALDARVVRRVLRESGPQNLLNGYGPTETTTFALTCRVAQVGDQQHSIPLGRPISQTQVYVLDEQGQPVPVGVWGEICIGGRGVARGYLGRPKLTAERFVSDPFGEAGGRLYRSGDVGRWRADGTVEYLGRNDAQVKVRGYRIELGEIESQLREHPGVGEAVVLARQAGADAGMGEKCLVAYVTARRSMPAGSQDPGQPDPELEVDGLRSYLKRRVPAYMVPAAFVVLERFPLTANGKVDRRSLPEPGAQAYRRGQYEPLQGEIEIALGQIWQELLQVERLGRQDDFFELGGHSLLAVQMISRVRAMLERELSVSDVFETPTLAALARMLHAVRDDGKPIEPVFRGAEPLPLSDMQQRLWFVEQLNPDAGRAYHIGTMLRLQGTLDVIALRRALDRIVGRHEALRTVFRHEAARAVQVIGPCVPFDLLEKDLTELGSQQLEEQLAREVQQESDTRFDLSRGPLIRGRLLRRSVDDHLLLLTMHHIISDGWSISVLTKELSALYAAYRQAGREPFAGAGERLPQLPVQYADYTLWHRQRLQGPVLQEQLRYWHESLQGAPELLSLPTDRTRPARASYRGDSVAVELGESLSKGLTELSHRHGTTLFMTLYSGFAVLLARLSGQSDVVIGTAVANRPRVELEELIGFFVNTLPLRCRVGGEQRVSDLLREVKRQTLSAYSHAEIPLERVVEALQPQRTLSHNPLFQVMFALQNTPRSQWELPGLRLSTPELAGMSTAQCDLTLSLQETGGRIVGVLNYARDLFEPETIERWVECLQELLHGMVHDDQQMVAELPLLNGRQREQVLRQFNEPTQPPAPARCIHEMIEEWVRREPDAVAVVYGEQCLTYAQLNAHANHLAHHLRTLGVAAGERVVVSLSRSPHLIVSELAILKCGAVYVPVDPQWPPERQVFVQADCGARWVLGEAGALARQATPGSPINVDEVLGRGLDEEGADEPSARLAGEAGACLIYTSGSTGQPKGVLVPHRAISHMALNNGYMRIEPADRLSFTSNPAYDASTFEVWGALLNGASLVIVPKRSVLDTALLCEQLSEQGVTVVFLITPLFHKVISTAGIRKPLASFECVLFGGDNCDPQVLRQLLSQGAPRRLLHMYGPAEATTFASFYPVESLTESQITVPIGGPISNTRIYILDAHLQPAPIGVSGEIYIGGAGVARGYLQQPRLTSERFVADPFGDEPGARLYRTGDLGRWDAHGNVEFLGRNDRQVKVRGFRIELGEIEAQLLRHPLVKEAIVVVREGARSVAADATADRRLVAYYTESEQGPAGPATEVTAAVDSLRAYLRQQLPEYMVPAAFVVLQRLPLTLNGKVDREALPEPSMEAYRRGQYDPPQGEIEIALAQIWQDLLPVERVGRQDDFFDLGGHSLLAVQLAARVRAVLEREIAVSDVFEAPTLAALARMLRAARGEATPIARFARGAEPLALSDMQRRLWFVDQLDPDAGRAYQIGTLLRLEGELDVAALRRALDRIVLRHEALRTVFRHEAEQTVQVIVPQAPFSLLEKDFSALGSQEREGCLAREIQAESDSRFDLSTGPLIRGRLLRLSGEEHALLLTMHHIVSDGWSISVLTKELSALYAAYRQGSHESMAELPVQYADYTLWQKQRLQGPVLQEQLHYWRESLLGAPELLSLPTDRPRPARATYRGDSVAVELEESLSKGLRELSHRHGTTLFMTLYSGFAVLLSRLSGQPDVVIGTPVANRPRVELEELIGFFVNTLALRCRVSSEQRVCELLRDVKRQTLSAYNHAEVPLERVVEVLQPRRSLSHNPLFQVVFALQNTPRSQWDLPGLTLSAPGLGALRTAQFDLTLLLQETGGRIAGVLNYSRDLFDRETIERWAESLQELLQAMVRDDQQAIAALPLLNERQREQVLVRFNTPAAGESPPADQCIHELFEEQARRTPDAVAVVYEEQCLTYAQLNVRASQLARALQAHCVRAQEHVALWLPRSVELLLAQLAVLKCGASYVPLDTDLPEARQKLLLRDCAVRVVLCWEGGRPCPLEGIEYIEVEEATQATAAASGVERGFAVRSEWIAYVMYTSGSSGQPKGVEIPHRGIVRLVRENGYAVIGTEDRVAFASTPAFDASTFEVWGALANGAAVRIVKPQELLEGRKLAQGLKRDGVNVLWLTVGLFNQYATSLHDLWAQLKYLLVGGDALDAHVVRQVLSGGGPQNLLNGYGPTETTTFALTCPVVRVGEQQHSIPLGRPISQTRVYVLDERGQPTPIGVCGEICIGGRGVARGYLGRPELTAERFVSDPFGEAGGRLYRSGDLGRWTADGTIEYLGRTDAQVKVRGYRIELGEIESQLREHAGVAEVVVLARQEDADAGMGGKRLVAYVTPRRSVRTGCAGHTDLAAPELEVDSLRGHLRERVPAYMVPAAFVVLDRLPLTTNGKVDRLALPQPDAEAYRRGQYESPRGETEIALAQIWQEMLHVERVGRQDDFFELGGHSLLAQQLVSRIRQHFSVVVELAAIFETPLLMSLAQRIADFRVIQEQQSLPRQSAAELEEGWI